MDFEEIVSGEKIIARVWVHLLDENEGDGGCYLSAEAVEKRLKCPLQCFSHAVVACAVHHQK